MSLQTKIREDLKTAMKARDEMRLSVIRGLITLFTNESIAKSMPSTNSLSEDDVVSLIRRAIKQRKDSIDQFTKGGRIDLADKEKAELIILESYLPLQMSREEILKIAKKKKEEMGIVDKSKMGVFMGAVMKELKGKADGALVKEVVESLFE
jgi:uncharacterized protein YqeY